MLNACERDSGTARSSKSQQFTTTHDDLGSKKNITSTNSLQKSHSQNNHDFACCCICFINSSSLTVTSVNFRPTRSCISRYLATQRSRHTLSPLFNSASLYLGGMHFLWHDAVIRLYMSLIISISSSCTSAIFSASSWGTAILTKRRLEFSPLSRTFINFVHVTCRAHTVRGHEGGIQTRTHKIQGYHQRFRKVASEHKI